jgi:polyisoprenoid-binding protein YceI
VPDLYKAGVLFRRACVYVAAAISLYAQPIAINLDPSKTRIEFTLADVLHTVHGTFKMKSGQLELNSEMNTISGQVIVDAASGESGNAARDRRMRNTFLEADRYPEITFTATGMEGMLSPNGSSSVTITGWFRIHGARHQLSVPMQIQMFGAQATAKGHFVVPYVAWGIKNPSTFILRVNQQVDIDVTAVVSLVRNRN